jgi:hypothetical protein
MVTPIRHYHFWPWLVLIVSVGIIHIVLIDIINNSEPLNYIFGNFLVQIKKNSDKNSSSWVP